MPARSRWFAYDSERFLRRTLLASLLAAVGGVVAGLQFSTLPSASTSPSSSLLRLCRSRRSGARSRLVVAQSADGQLPSVVDEGRAIAESTLQNVRDLSQLLHPSMLDDFGLPEAVSAHLRSFSKRTGIRTQLTHDGLQNRLPADVEVCIYRIVQEALTNIVKHSGAGNARVVVRRGRGSVAVFIEDDGKGFSLEDQPDTSAIGLMGIRERVSLLGGSMELETEPEKGTTLIVRIPLTVGGGRDI